MIHSDFIAAGADILGGGVSYFRRGSTFPEGTLGAILSTNINDLSPLKTEAIFFEVTALKLGKHIQVSRVQISNSNSNIRSVEATNTYFYTLPATE